MGNTQEYPKYKNYPYGKYLIQEALLGNKYAKKRLEKYTRLQEGKLPKDYQVCKPERIGDKTPTIYDNRYPIYWEPSFTPVLPSKEHYQDIIDAEDFNENHNARRILKHTLRYCIYASIIYSMVAFFLSLYIDWKEVLGAVLILNIVSVIAYAALAAMIAGDLLYENKDHHYKKLASVPKRSSDTHMLSAVSPFFDKRLALNTNTPQAIQDAYWRKHQEHYQEVSHFAELIDGMEDHNQIIKVKRHIVQLGEDHLEELESFIQDESTNPLPTEEVRASIIDQEINSYRISRGRETI